MNCWVCGDPDFAYVDVLGVAWCDKHYDEIFAGIIMDEDDE